MQDTIKILGVKMDGFSFNDMIATFYHSESCPVESKGEYNKGDRLIGTACHDNRDYLIYSCGGCGGTYILEGRVSDKIAKGI